MILTALFLYLQFVTRIRSHTKRISSRVLKRSWRTSIFVCQISVESGYVVNKLGSPEVSSLGYLRSKHHGFRIKSLSCSSRRSWLGVEASLCSRSSQITSLFVYSEAAETSRQSQRNGGISRFERSAERETTAAFEKKLPQMLFWNRPILRKPGLLREKTPS